MQPYRLEMGTSLTTDRGDSLYSFWGDRITDQLNADIAESPGANVLVNLASNEYFGSVAGKIDARIMTPTFLDSKNGGPYKIVSFFANGLRRHVGLDHPSASRAQRPSSNSTAWATATTPNARPPTSPSSSAKTARWATSTPTSARLAP